MSSELATQFQRKFRKKNIRKFERHFYIEERYITALALSLKILVLSELTALFLIAIIALVFNCIERVKNYTEQTII